MFCPYRISLFPVKLDFSLCNDTIVVKNDEASKESVIDVGFSNAEKFFLLFRCHINMSNIFRRGLRKNRVKMTKERCYLRYG
jgi:hypothetical protein